jgi:hypothetical protein
MPLTWRTKAFYGLVLPKVKVDIKGVGRCASLPFEAAADHFLCNFNGWIVSQRCPFMFDVLKT